MAYRIRNRFIPHFILCLLAFLGLRVHGSYAQCPSFSFPSTPICAGDACDTNPTTFTYSGASTPATTFRWDFGDPAVQTDTSSQRNPSYIYSRPGSYTASLTVRNGADSVTCSQTVNVGGFGEFIIGAPEDINKGEQEEEICIEDLPATLTPIFGPGSTPPTNPKYLWSNGDTTATSAIDTAGCYSVQITDSVTGCTRTNKVTISLYKPDPDAPQPPQERGRWYFGNGAGIKFVGGQPETVTDGQVNVPEGSSTVSDASGKLLFYTDGKTIYRPDGTVMPNGDGLLAGTNVTQGVLIVSQPGCATCASVFYVFTISDTGELRYTVVDMRADAGAGGVPTGLKNIPLFNTSTERVTAVQGDADSTGAPRTWILTHDANTNNFRVYPLDGKGLGAPVTSAVGTVHGAEPAKGEGYMKVSPDGTRVAVVIPGVAGGANNQVQLFDFDKATGKLSNPKNIDLGGVPPEAYGVEFFGDSTLYVSLTGEGATPSQLVQYSLRSADTSVIAASRKVIATSAQKFGALQIDPDKQKIYLAIEGSASVGVINQPGDTLNVDFQENGFPLGGPTSQLGLPNVSPTETPPGFGQDFGFDGPPCVALGDSVIYEFQAQPDRAPRNDGQPNSFYVWTFPDGSTSTLQDPRYTFPGPGTYTVRLTITNDCREEVIPPKTITILRAPDPFQIQPNAPNVRQEDNITTCGPSVTLDAQANVAGSTYQWFFNGVPVVTGGQSRTLTVTQEGTYLALVINGPCALPDVVNVTFTQPQVALGADTTLCGVGTSITLNAGNPGATYQWSTGQTSQFITFTPVPGTSTTVSVTVTDPTNPQCIGTDTIVVRAGAPSTVTPTVTPSATCTGAGTGTITLNVAPVGTSFAWTGPNGFTATTRDIANLVAGTYTVVVTNASGCQTTANVSVNSTAFTVNTTATVAPATCTNENGTITLTTTGGTPPYSYFINNQPVGTGATLPLIRPVGTYNLEVRDATFGISGCRFFLTATIEPPVDKPVVNAVAIVTGCNTATLIANSSGGTRYEWRRIPAAALVNTLERIPVSQAGQYTVTVINESNGCATTDTVAVNFPPAPTANIAPGVNTVCEGESITLTANGPPAGVTYRYQWQRDGFDIAGATARTLTVNSSGAYRVSVRNPQTNCPPVSSDTRNIVITPVPVAAFVSRDTTICAGDAAVLTAQTIIGAYSWVNRATGQVVGTTSRISVTPLQSTVYVLTVTNNGCSTSAPITVNVLPRPFADFSNTPNTFCEGASLVLDATNPPAGAPATYEWRLNGAPIAGQTGPTLRVTEPGTYAVTVRRGQCSFTAQHIINALVRPPVPNIPRKVVEFCFRDPDNPNALADVDAGPGEFFTYEWFALNRPNVKIGEGQILPLGAGTYLVRFTNDPGCQAQDTI
ncbi:MAG: PKD domain-containing protein, partial [Ferruginibacter sp.]|nr:PKD domain-containing protein [Cytophagales bacterium]